SVHQYPALQAFPCALAHLYAETGREREAQTALDDLLARDLAQLHVDEEWLFGVSLLPDVCAFLADAPAAGRVYDLLRPYEALNAVAAPGAAFGSVARGLGVLATTLGRYAEAERHFASALAMERGMGAGPGRAHVERGLAAMLGERGETGDGERSRELAASAAATYRALGMDAWAARTAGGS
ncbi:MAG TPA: hypothetical protein VK279_07810, partial [Solirubrobacteraceae bacterium]|nr:hypothetical protein [Solirubrobacteraceae bacterium]